MGRFVWSTLSRKLTLPQTPYMKTLTFNNGDTLPAIGLGTWKSAPGEVKKAVIHALESGYRHIDCAAIYGNETEIGEAFNAVFSKGSIKREDVFITSKLWNNAHLANDVQPAIEKTLADLQLDYLDLYLIHWPVAFKPGVMMPSSNDDYLTPQEAPIIDTWNAMIALKEKGLAKHIGVSNFSVTKLENLLSQTSVVPEMNQVELQPLLQQNELLDYCTKKGILLTAYSPLGSGDRSEGMKQENEPNMFEIPAIQSIAQKHNITAGQVLIHFSVNRGTAVIPKSTNPGRIEENLAAAGINLDASDVQALQDLDRHYRYVTGKFYEVPEKGYPNTYDE